MVKSIEAKLYCNNVTTISTALMRSCLDASSSCGGERVKLRHQGLVSGEICPFKGTAALTVYFLSTPSRRMLLVSVLCMSWRLPRGMVPCIGSDGLSMSHPPEPRFTRSVATRKKWDFIWISLITVIVHFVVRLFPFFPLSPSVRDPFLAVFAWLSRFAVNVSHCRWN